MKQTLLSLLLTLLPLVASADAVEIDGIYYNLDTTNKTAEVTENPNKYSGSIVIPSSVLFNNDTYGVTSIADYAFESCSGLTNITIPNSVTSIGVSALGDCTGLQSIVIPNSVTSIGYGAFEYCNGLQNITLSSCLEVVQDKTFYGCTSLTSIVIPESVTSIGAAFGMCGALTNITLPDGISFIADGAFDETVWYENQHDGIVYAGKVAYKYKGTMPSNTSIVLEEGTKAIAVSAFEKCSGLTSIEIPNSVTSIGSKAFAQCSGLTSIDIPNSVTSIGGDAFDGTSWFNNQQDGLVYAGKVAYMYKGTMPSNTSIVLEEGTKVIAGSAFEKCSGLTSITIPNSVTSIGDYAFYGCSGLTSIEIPNSVTSIGSKAFYGCSGLTSIVVDNDNIVYDSRENCNAIIETSTNTMIVGCKNTTIPQSVISINEGVLSEVKNKCGSTVLYQYDENSGVLTISGRGSMYNYNTGNAPWESQINNIVKVIIEDGVTTIGSSSFSGCKNMVSVNIPNSMTSIGGAAFKGCSGLTSVTIPNSVNSIEGSAFQWCSGLTSVTIPNSVTSIGNNTFYGCSSLTSINIPNSVISIGDDAFHGCSDLTSIDIPNSVTSIGKQAFYYCSGLTSIDIPNSVTSIGEWAFDGCSSLTSINIPNSVTSIGQSAFKNCYLLTAVYISDLSAWCKIAFTDNNSNPLYYAHHLYLNNEEIKDLVIPDDITSIGVYTFRNGSGFTSLQIPNHITTIGEITFQGCSGLKTVVLPNQLRIIKANAFKGCSKLESLNIPASVEYIYQNAFADCSSLQTVTAQPTTPSFLYDNSFSNYAIPLNVPSGCKEAYQSAQGWKNFTTINDGNVYYQMSIESQGRGKVSYGTTEVTNGQKTVDVKEGTDAVLTLTADNGYQVASVTVNGEDKTAYVVNGQLTISNMSANTTVTVSFGVAGEFAKVVIGSDRMATFCPLADADFSTLNLKAYIGSGFNRQTGVLTLTRVKDVPAGEGLLLKGDPGTYFVPYSQSYSVYSNLLKGVTIETNLAATTGGYANYVLASGSNGTGFYRVPTEGTTLAAGRAYLSITAETAASRSALRLAFDDEDEATGINASLTNSEERIVDSAVYDLQGRRVEQPLPGLYIRNGKKVIIK